MTRQRSRSRSRTRSYGSFDAASTIYEFTRRPVRNRSRSRTRSYGSFDAASTISGLARPQSRSLASPPRRNRRTGQRTGNSHEDILGTLMSLNRPRYNLTYTKSRRSGKL